MIRKIEVERFTLNSSKPFDQVVAALNSAVGHPDMAKFWNSTHQVGLIPIGPARHCPIPPVLQLADIESQGE